MHELAAMPTLRNPAFALATRIVAIGAITLLLIGAADAQTASGTFMGRTLTLDIAGAYSYWDRSGDSQDRVIKVVVSNAEFKAALLDDWYDRQSAVHDLFVDDRVKIVTFDFDPDGRYRGYSYYFGSGDGCGWCYDSAVRSTVRGAGGRLNGSIAFTGPGAVAFEIRFDVPIPDKAWGDALPAGGGAPGRAYLGYHKALAASDATALTAVSDDRGKGLLDKHEKQGDLARYLDFRWDDMHYRMQNVTIVGG